MKNLIIICMVLPLVWLGVILYPGGDDALADRLRRFVSTIAVLTLALASPLFAACVFAPQTMGNYVSGINEIAQDLVEARLGIAAFAADDPEALRRKISEWPAAGIAESAAVGERELFAPGFRLRLSRCSSADAKTDVGNSAAPDLPYRINWSKNILWLESRGRSQALAGNRIENAAIALGIWCGLLMMAGEFFVVRPALRHKKHTRGLGIFAVISTVVGAVILNFAVTHRLYRYDSHREANALASKIAEHRDLLRQLLATASTTGLIPLRFLADYPEDVSRSDLERIRIVPTGKPVKNFHFGQAFVSKPPLLASHYLRINADVFNYLYFAPDMTIDEVAAINPMLKITDLGSGVYLGRYQRYIDATDCLLRGYWINIVALIVIVLYNIWIIIRIKYGFNNRNLSIHALQ